ncbi:PorV/PorQ family protein [candidate division KSB1 bacterium]|nr:PorV/PorQ family protein [candidate division KSB1 bacterium]
MKKILYTLLLMMMSTGAFAQVISKAGSSVLTFLKIDTGARQVGMGGASVANTENAMAMYWNPAGIARLTSRNAVFNHIDWIADVSLNFVGIAIPLGRVGTIGIAGSFLSMDPIEKTTVDYPNGTGETFDAGNYAFGFTYANSLTDRFCLGGTVKIVNENIYNCSATGVAFDIGTLFTTRFDGLQMGMSISNFGTKMQMNGRDLLTRVDIDPKRSGNNETINTVLKTEKYDLPLFFRLGFSYDVLKGFAGSNLILAIDALHPSDDVEYVNVGCEYSLNNMFFLRSGYKSMFARESEEGVSFGGGVQIPLFKYVIQIDYGYRDFGRLEDIQVFTCEFIF